MDVRLSSEQLALRDSAATLLAKLGPQTVAALDDDERVAKLDAAVHAAGWRELRVATDGGLPLASGVEAAIIAEEMGRYLADTAFLGPTIAADMARRSGAGSHPAPEWIPNVDLTRPHSEFDVISTVDDNALALGLALTAADLVGVMRGAVDLACSYAKDRAQYGQPIGSFQAVQHLLADAYVVTEGARSAALHAAWAVDALPAADAVAAGALAKAYAARAARRVCETAIQVHGGIGNTWECLAHVYLRRALLSADLFGGTAANLERVLAHHGIGGGDGLR